MTEASEGPSSWRQAQAETLAALRELRNLLTDPDEVEVLTAIHATCGLCERSSQEKAHAAAEDPGAEATIKCDYCPAFDQLGGCRTVNRRMTDCVLGKNWRGLEALVDDFIDKVKRLDLPAEGFAEHGSGGSDPPQKRGPDDQTSG